MAKIVAFISVTLMGRRRRPAGPTRTRAVASSTAGGRRNTPTKDSGKLAAEGMVPTGALLLGRRTYEDLLTSWNEQGGPFKDMLNNTPKYVASTTLTEPLPWPNSTLLEGDAVEAVARLREEPGKDIVVLGSGDLLRSLMRRRLVDRFVLLVHPLVLGTGQRLFDDGVPMLDLRLEDSKTTSTVLNRRDLYDRKRVALPSSQARDIGIRSRFVYAPPDHENTSNAMPITIQT